MLPQKLINSDFEEKVFCGLQLQKIWNDISSISFLQFHAGHEILILIVIPWLNAEVQSMELSYDPQIVNY